MADIDLADVHSANPELVGILHPDGPSMDPHLEVGISGA